MSLFSKTYEEVSDGSWESSGYAATDEEAHRDTEYKAASVASQTLTFMLTELKRMSRDYGLYASIIVAFLIPVAYFLRDIIGAIDPTSGMGSILVLLTVLVSIFTANACGKQIPNEYQEKTAYMNLAMPVSRTSFALGKLFAGLTVCLGIFMLAYVLAYIMSMIIFEGSPDTDKFIQSIAYMVMGVVVFSTTAFGLSTVFTRANVLLPVVLMFFLMPIVGISIDQYLDDSIIALFPCWFPDYAVAILGGLPMSFGMFGAFSMIDILNVPVFFGIGAAWSLGMVAFGLYMVQRKQL